MSQQSIRQRARRTAREIASKRRQESVARERRRVEHAAQVMVALGERDEVIAATEQRAGVALWQLTEVEGLSVREAAEWCGGAMTVREAIRLKRLAGDCSGLVTEQAGGHR